MDPSTHDRLRDAAFRRYADALGTGAAPDVDDFVGELPEELRAEVAEMIAELLRLAPGGQAPPPTLEAGARFGEFELIEPLGAGGAGVVWVARQASLGRRVALKFLKAQLVVSPTALERFRREAFAAARLSHPGVVQVFASGARGGVPYLALELVEGGSTLVDWLEARRIARALPASHFREVAELFRATADALAHAHARGVVHRDVKPSNVLIDAEGRPKVADFGTAMLEEELHLTRTGDFFGTPFYMSPEQAASRRMGIDHRTDVFSLGATLYEALSLTRAFDGDTSVQVFTKILTVDPPDPRSLRSQVPRELAVICMKALEKTPADRYADMAGLRDDLAAYLAGRPIAARPPGLLQRARRKARRHPRLATAAAVALVLAVPLVLGWRGRSVARAEARGERERVAALGVRLGVPASAGMLLDEADTLWPLAPARLAAMDSWSESARAVGGALRAVRADLEDLARGRGPLELPGAGERFEHLRAGFEPWMDARTSAFAGALFERSLAAAARDIEQFAAPDAPLRGGSSARFGLGVDARAALVRRVVVESLESAAAQAAWAAAAERVAADGRFAGLALAPVFGLLPLGADRESGLEEFAHLLTGDVPARDPDSGRLVMTPACGLVFVLVPGGVVTIGAQGGDPRAPRFDADFDAASDLALQRVALDPFLISKYELHRGAFERLAGSDPSFNPAIDGRAMPVEYVSFELAQRVLARAELCLPTQAQWEVAARGGTDGRFWFTADDAADLANVAGIEARDAERTWRAAEGDWRTFDDGYVWSAPVDALRPNPYGLHHVHGNLAELCADLYVPPGTPLEPPRAGDGLLRPRGASSAAVPSRVQRGGFFATTIDYCRVTFLGFISETKFDNVTGLRPTHSIPTRVDER
jgi:formylglycine-generating enzyme required for sulfatase activity